MKTKIFLADLAHTYSVQDQSLTVPLGIGYVKAYCEAMHGDNVEFRLFKHPERLLKAAAEEQPEVFGFANYGWNENLNREIGHYLRSVFPDALIVAGGPNLDPDNEQRLNFLQKHDYIDFLVVDGGEEPFAELIAWHREGSGDYGKLPGNLAWRDGDAIRGTPERKLKKIIEGIPSPYLKGDLDEFLYAGMIPLFETNRGCPFRCTFCAWGSASKDLVRRLDLDQALAEIAYVGERSKARNWIICDANFGILPRDIELAKAIRKVREIYGHLKRCHIWLAKNVTDRNLEIGSILEEMVVPVMAVQSMDDEVLKHIKRDNISLDTYKKYHDKFHEIGSRTYSDTIVPLPCETLDTHLQGLRTLMGLGVDNIQNHNMRLLAGAETNSKETRNRFKFKTRFRLIHGDAGIYRAPDGKEIRAFEYEESLRSTETMSEEDLFYLRKLHFLVEFCWNIQVYKALLYLGSLHGINPVDVLQQLLTIAESREPRAESREPRAESREPRAESREPRAESRERPDLYEFFDEFARRSRDEWFDSAEQIEGFFADPANFDRLINQEFEKLNIQFGVIALRDYKAAFDSAIFDILEKSGSIPYEALAATAKVNFAQFPSLSCEPSDQPVQVPIDLPVLSNTGQLSILSSSGSKCQLRLVESPMRRDLRHIIAAARGKTLSKIIDTQGFSLRDLRLAIADEAEAGQFRRAV